MFFPIQPGQSLEFNPGLQLLHTLNLLTTHSLKGLDRVSHDARRKEFLIDMMDGKLVSFKISQPPHLARSSTHSGASLTGGALLAPAAANVFYRLIQQLAVYHNHITLLCHY